MEKKAVEAAEVDYCQVMGDLNRVLFTIHSLASMLELDRFGDTDEGVVETLYQDENGTHVISDLARIIQEKANLAVDMSGEIEEIIVDLPKKRKAA